MRYLNDHNLDLTVGRTGTSNGRERVKQSKLKNMTPKNKQNYTKFWQDIFRINPEENAIYDQAHEEILIHNRKHEQN